MTYVRRRLGEQVQYCAVWEWQKRGVLHRHFLLRVERATTQKRVQAAVRGAARSFEFGGQVDVQAITGNCAQQINYIAKYASKTVDSIDGRRLLDVRTGELKRSAGFRAWSASRSWGDTIKTVKQRDCVWARSGARHQLADAAGSDGAVGALDLFSESSTVDPLEAVDPPRFSAPSVLL